MNTEDIYKYFRIKEDLNNAIRDYIEKLNIGTPYEGYPLFIHNVTNKGGGIIEVKVDQETPPCNDYIERCYDIRIEDLGES